MTPQVHRYGGKASLAINERLLARVVGRKYGGRISSPERRMFTGVNTFLIRTGS